MFKNIEIKRLNENGEYETMYPKTIGEQVEGIYTKKETLKDVTKKIYGLSNSAVPDDIFAKMIMPVGSYGYSFYVAFEDGAPATNIKITGLKDFDNTEYIITDDEGYAYGYSTSETITASINMSNYLGYNSVTQEIVSNPNPVFTHTNISLTFNDEWVESFTNKYVLLTSSKTYIVTNQFKTFDMCAVGGGGSGAGGINFTGGGAGGYAENVMNHIVVPGEYTFTIGQGGRSVDNNGVNGGNTTVLQGENILVQVNGGDGGKHEGIAYGNGNGGGSGNKGKDGTVRVFNDSSLPLPGGGGGGYHRDIGGGAGGADFGGAAPANRGNGPGGGGGGGRGNVLGGNGYQGAVYLRGTIVRK